MFLCDGEVPPLGHRIVQPDLARTLEALAERGTEGFYGGVMARQLAEGVIAAGGLWTLQDLERYRVVERAPIVGKYRGVRVVSVPPPSSGGVVSVEALNILEGFDLDPQDPAARTHLIVEALPRLPRPRAHLGDPDFVSMPLERLLDKRFAAAERVLSDSGAPLRALPRQRAARRATPRIFP